ncbi:uncharacterized protein [Solanum lycopersicum]|uniref:uncharacterized protein n=1 Tax=Solanum lycopersicum TaxID=4081 RepID=UPI0037478618
MTKTELCYLFLVLVVAEPAIAGSPVKFLPGFKGPLPFQLETGYVGVGDSEDVQLFYYFIESESGYPDSDPLMLWITGGPGCSALSGLIYEIGPITFGAVEYNGSLPTMILNPYSWTKVSSIIFLDLPVGTGFSYATTPAALQTSDLQTSDHAYQFLRKWFVDHPTFLKNPLYIGGDSYSGMVVPIISQIIASNNEMEIKPFINLKGYLLGNPSTFEGENNYEIPFAYGMGLISDELYESLNTNCKGEYININPSNLLCLQDVQTFKELLRGINKPHILEPKCKRFSPRPHQLFGERRSLNEKLHQLNNLIKCRNNWYKHSYHWADDDQVRDALNIRKGTIGKWERCATLKFQKIVTNSIPYHENLSSKGYRSLIYSGDHDKIVTFRSTQAWIKSLNYSIVDDWRAWTVDNQVAGYTRSYSNQMTFATVKGAGHTAPEYKPRECLAMLTRWILNLPLNFLTLQVQAAATVKFLPGFDGPLPFHLETGYVGVGKEEKHQLFYYFIKSESDPGNDPLILWLTGGPGCSSFNGVVYEIGPLYYKQKKYNGSLPTLGVTPNSWTKVANIIFLEQPVNTGFSYATTPEAMHVIDVDACTHVYQFLLKWLVDHPEFSSNNFYLGGDSYSGIVVPRVVQLISDGIEAGNKPLVNLKGYLLGNPLTFPEEKNFMIPFLVGMAIIPIELYQSMMQNCKGEYRKEFAPTNAQCSQDLNIVDELSNNINDQHVLDPLCGSETELKSPFPSKFRGSRRSIQENAISPSCYGKLVDRHELSNYWANDPRVQKALHVRKGTIDHWARCKQNGIKKYYTFTSMDSISYHRNHSAKGYRSLIYSGDHDMGVPFQSTEAWIKSLNYSIVDNWRQWIVNGQVAGYTRSYANKMTYATVKATGHVAPEYKREECFNMFKRWISHNPL